MNRAFAILLAAVTIDSIGIGLIFPILPGLIREVAGPTDSALLFGVIMAVYALMQFICSPILGALSDRFGRRPLMLLSVAGSAIDYLIMTFSPWFAVLVIGRMISGITGANMAVATAYIADITPEDKRAGRFGMVSAAFGVGFIVGPVIGGLLGAWWLRSPFLVGAALNAINFALALFVLPESRKPTAGAKLEWSALNPFAPLRWAFSFRVLIPLLALFFLFNVIGNVPATIWVLYGHDKFGWDTLTVGLSLAVFGACLVLSQALLVGPLTKWLGETRTLFVGLICDTLDHAFAADPDLASRFPSCPAAAGASCRSLISYVTDRPGHDQRYAIDATKLAHELGNRCGVGFETGLRRTIRWYLDREDWWRDVTSGTYKAWIDKNYGFRIAV